MNKKYIIAITFLIVVLVATYLLWEKWQKNMGIQNSPYKASQQPSLQPGAGATGDGSYTIPTNLSNKLKFISPKLGISFIYTSFYNNGEDSNSGQHIKVHEEKNRVYIYVSNEDYTKGQFIEVFKKNPQDSLHTAIQKTLLKGYAETNCFVTSYDNPFKPYDQTSVYETASIGFPYSNEYGNGSTQRGYTSAAKCPRVYEENLTVSQYFMMNKNHSTKFVFFSLGQNGPLWDDPIQFLN